LLIFCFLFSFSFVKTVRISADSRIEALDYSVDNIPKESTILSEVYDLGITPFNSHFSNITIFDFYDLEANTNKAMELESLINNSGYIILPSQRIMRSRIVNSEVFPQGSRFYTDLISGALGYEKVYETPCDIFCKIVYMGDPIFNVEETVNVFDRPTLFIFKKK
jgi:hypothetical protein